MNFQTKYVHIALLIFVALPQVLNAEHQYCVIPDRAESESRICVTGVNNISAVLKEEFSALLADFSGQSELPLQYQGLPNPSESDQMVLIYPEVDTNGVATALTVFSTPLDPRWNDAVNGCQFGDQKACALQGGMMIQRGYSAPRGVVAAQTLLSTSCDAKVAEACHSMGQLKFYGLAGANSIEEGVSFYDQACSLGHSTSCLQLGHGFSGRFLAVPEDLSKAVDYYNFACNLGDMSGCMELGYAYALAKGVSSDKPKSAALWKKACDGNEKIACYNYADLIQFGSTMEDKDELALSYYQISCDMGFEKACSRLNN